MDPSISIDCALIFYSKQYPNSQEVTFTAYRKKVAEISPKLNLR